MPVPLFPEPLRASSRIVATNVLFRHGKAKRQSKGRIQPQIQENVRLGKSVKSKGFGLGRGQVHTKAKQEAKHPKRQTHRQIMFRRLRTFDLGYLQNLDRATQFSSCRIRGYKQHSNRTWQTKKRMFQFVQASDSGPAFRLSNPNATQPHTIQRAKSRCRRPSLFVSVLTSILPSPVPQLLGGFLEHSR